MAMAGNLDAELLRSYRTELAELKMNSKPIISSLTMIAGEQRHLASTSNSVASALLSHITECPQYQRLPALYVLDSIAKNIGQPYVGLFEKEIREVMLYL